MTEESEAFDSVEQWSDYRFGGAVPEITEKHKLRFAFYGRCSTDDNQDPVTSKAWQVRVASNLINGSGGEIVVEFFDIGFSRSLPWQRRPEAAALLEELARANRRFDALVVGEGQRCFYGTQFADLAPLFDHYGVQLWLPELSGAYNSDNTTQDMLMAITGGMSKGERKRIQERVKQGMAAQIETEGRWLGGRPPYGYKTEPWKKHPNPKKASEGIMQKRLVLDNDAASVVQRIFQQTIDGAGIRAIARSLNDDRIPCPSAHDPERNPHRRKDGWQHSAVKGILQNPRYTGYEFWGKFKRQEELISAMDVQMGYQTRLVRSKEQLVRSHNKSHPAIIDTDIFLKVQKILDTRAAKTGRSNARVKPAYIFQSLIFCDFCGRRLQSHKSKSGNVTYVCRGGRDLEKIEGTEKHPRVLVREKELSDLVGEWIRGLFSEENLESTVDALLDADNEAESPIEIIQQERAMTRATELRERLGNMIRLMGKNLISDEEGAVELDIIRRDIAVSETELEAYNQMISERPEVSEREEVRALVMSFISVIDEVWGEDAKLTNSSPNKLNSVYHMLGLVTTYKHAQNAIYLEIQPKQDPQAQPSVTVLGRVREGTHTGTVTNRIGFLAQFVHAA